MTPQGAKPATRVSKLALVAALVALALLGLACLQVFALPDLLQYVTPAPIGQAGTQTRSPDMGEDEGDQAQTEPQAVARTQLLTDIQSLRDAMAELTGVVSAHTLTGYAHDVAVSDGGQASQKAELFALSENAQAIYPMVAFTGRLLYEEELRYGDRVALLSAQLAVDLFRISDPTGKEITIDGEKYVVMGTVRRDRQVGDAGKYFVYLPLRALAKHGKTQLSLLTLSAVPVPAAGAAAALQQAGSAWHPLGSFYQLEREKLRALMTPLALAGFFWLYAIVRLFKALFAWVVGHADSVKRRLRTEYMRRMLPGILGRTLLMLLALGALLGLCGLWARFMMRPVLLFPEWVPEVPVEWGMIEATFWNLQFNGSELMQLLTPQLTRLRFFGGLAVTGSIVLLLAVILQQIHARRNR